MFHTFIRSSMNHGTFVDPSTLLALVHGCPLGRLGGVEVVLLGELHVAEELGVHALHPVSRISFSIGKANMELSRLVHLLEPQLGIGLPGRVPVLLPGLVVIGVVLRLGHGARLWLTSLQWKTGS